MPDETEKTPSEIPEVAESPQDAPKEPRYKVRKTWKRRSFGPYKFHPKNAEKALKAIRIGNRMVVAAAMAHVSVETLGRWIRAGKDELARWEKAGQVNRDTGKLRRKPPLAKFYFDFTIARHEAEFRHVTYIDRNAREGFRSSQSSEWWLERVVGGRYAKRETLKHVGADGKNLPSNVPPVVFMLPPNGRDVGPEGQAPTAPPASPPAPADGDPDSQEA